MTISGVYGAYISPLSLLAIAVMNIFLVYLTLETLNNQTHMLIRLENNTQQIDKALGLAIISSAKIAEQENRSDAGFRLIGLAHENTTESLLSANNHLTQIANDILTIEKQQLDSRQALGQFLAIIAANNSITIPDEVKKALFIPEPEPLPSAPQ